MSSVPPVYDTASMVVQPVSSDLSSNPMMALPPPPFTREPLEFTLLTKSHRPPLDSMPNPPVQPSFMGTAYPYTPYGPYILAPTLPIASSSRVDLYPPYNPPSDMGGGMSFVMPHQLNIPILGNPEPSWSQREISVPQSSFSYKAYQPQFLATSPTKLSLDEGNRQSGYNPVEYEEQEQYTQTSFPSSSSSISCTSTPPPLHLLTSSPQLDAPCFSAEEEEALRWIRSPTATSDIPLPLSALSPGPFPTPRLPPPPPVLRPTSFHELPLSTQLDLLPLQTGTKSPPAKTTPPTVFGWVPPADRPIPLKVDTSLYPSNDEFLLPPALPSSSSMTFDLVPQATTSGWVLGPSQVFEPLSATSISFSALPSSSAMSFDLPLASSPPSQQGTAGTADEWARFVPVASSSNIGEGATRGGLVRQLSRAGGKRKRGYRGDGTTGVKTETGGLPKARRVSVAKAKETSACPSCSEVFTRRSDMERHYRVHTGEKPFRCEHCLTSFSRKDKLKLHRSICRLNATAARGPGRGRGRSARRGR